MMRPFLTSLGQARTLPLQWPCFMAFQRPQRPRIVGPTTKYARCSSVQRRSRRKACYPGNTSLTPSSVHPQYILPGTHQSTKHHKAAGSALRPRYISVSTTTAMHATPSTPVGTPTVTRGKEPTMAIILDAADATIAARTGARVPACLALGPLADTSSTLRSPRGTDRPPIS